MKRFPSFERRNSVYNLFLLGMEKGSIRSRYRSRRKSERKERKRRKKNKKIKKKQRMIYSVQDRMEDKLIRLGWLKIDK